MLLTIHDANLKKVAFIDNDKQETLNYYDDTWTRSLETGSSTFEFTVYKKAIKSDTAINKTYNLLNERAFVSFRHNGKSYVFNVMTVEENEQTIKCYCENLNLELINEYANPYKATKAMSFVEYCNAMDLLNFTHLSVGINEISDQKRTLEWEGQDTKLARLLSLARKFDAEIDFDTTLNADSSIKSFKVNIYHENDATHQGVGRVRNDIQLTYGKNLKSIKRKIDKTGIYNAIRPTGKGKTKNAKGEEVETIVTIGGLGAWSENNADGVREFYQSGEMLYAPLSMQMYPSAFTSSTTNDQWIRKDLEVDSDNPTVIRAAGIANLRKNAYPAITYDVDGFLDVEVGDTVKIYDDGFSPILIVEARVSDQKISFTNPASNKTTFSNFKALENKLSDGIQVAFERLFEASKPYLIKLSTDNGVIFKNQIGRSLVTPSLYRGGKPVVSGVTWRWSLDGNTTTGMTYLVRGSSVTDTATLTVAAYIGNDEVAVDEISFVNVLDGLQGEKGEQGLPGAKGADGNGIANVMNYYLATTASTGVTRSTAGWTTTPQTITSAKRYHWNYRVELYTDGTSKTTEPAIIGVYGDKGDTGARGIQGIQGIRGEQGIPGEKGADGRTQYTHIAYADNATGGGFSQTDQTKAYIGMYQDFTATDSTNPTSYRWTKWKGDKGDTGAQGVPGAKGADGRTPYVHFAYSDNADGTGLTTSDNGQRYIGHYSDYTQADSTDKTKYRWTDRWARIDGGFTNIYALSKNKEITVNMASDFRLDISSGTISFKTTGPDAFVGHAIAHPNPYRPVYGVKIPVMPGRSILIHITNNKFTKNYVSYFDSNSNTVKNFTGHFTNKFSLSPSQLSGVSFITLRYGVGNSNIPIGTVLETKVKVEYGTIYTDWSPAPEDVEDKINSKADQVLTQEQLNALNERAQILDVELKAKATMDALSDLEKGYQSLVKSSADNRAKSEADLAEAGRRIDLLVTQFGGFKELKTFIDTYMSSSNEGLIIGKNDASSTIKVSSDRISMFSAGKEVMYISQGVIHIDNGIFTASVQIGRFRTEQYHLNANMNVIRYVG
ncbi:TPA: phage tail spike protein [Streptococcus suis]|uniref:Phage tail spike protein n=1 Tax=Streptococcus suis TaxID=1307 RepID=A0AAJ2UIA6_STRSU|nr:phage tail spike protein [Streptococcus suis]